jgi:septum formation protein
MVLIQHIKYLNSKKIVLASASPRRQELLRNIGLKFEVIPSTFEENLPHSSFPTAAAYALETSRRKAIEVAARASHMDLIIGSDTIVELDGTILEKPADAEDATRMLRLLSGSRHRVTTGVNLILPSRDHALHSFTNTTVVNFDVLEEEAIAAYVASGEPFGKSGSYGIQGIAGSFVKAIEGDFFNVMGFPLHHFSSEVSKLIKQGLL